jgi:hypothetical protein
MMSRNHFQIDYSEGFRQYSNNLPEEWVSLLMLNHKRLGRFVNVPSIPNELIINILDYTNRPRNFYIEDLNSSCGTYLNIKNTSSAKMSKGEYYLLGCDYLIKIIEISNSSLDYDIDEISIRNLMCYYRSLGINIIGDYCNNDIQFDQIPLRFKDL